MDEREERSLPKPAKEPVSNLDPSPVSRSEDEFVDDPLLDRISAGGSINYQFGDVDAHGALIRGQAAADNLG